MGRQIASYTREELHRKYPHLAQAIDEMIAADQPKFRNLRRCYSMGYSNHNGHARRMTLGYLIETLEDNGYEVEFVVRKK